MSTIMDDAAAIATSAAAIVAGQPPQKMTLAEILDAYSRILVIADEADGVLDDDVGAALDLCDALLIDKVERIESLAESLRAKADSVRQRVKALELHARALENRASRLHEWVTASLEAAGFDRYETPSYTLNQRKSPPRLAVSDEGAMIAWLRAYHPETLEQIERIDRRAVLAIAKAESVPGATIESGKHWRVQ